MRYAMLVLLLAAGCATGPDHHERAAMAFESEVIGHYQKGDLTADEATTLIKRRYEIAAQLRQKDRADTQAVGNALSAFGAAFGGYRAEPLEPLQPLRTPAPLPRTIQCRSVNTGIVTNTTCD